MLANVCAPGASILAILRNIDLAPRGEGGDAKAGQRIIPKEITITARRALEGVNRPFGYPAPGHFPAP
jgi:hypothetical protein